MSTPPSALRLGECASINGHLVARVGLCGAGAYVVDGEPRDLEAAEGATAAPAAPPLAVEAPAPPSRRRPRAPAPGPRACVPAPPPDSPELLLEVHDLLGAKRLFRLEHRGFAGGEAVVVRMRNPAHDAATELGTALIQVVTGGLHAEWGADRTSLVVARSRAVLAPQPPPRRSAPRRRP